MHKPKEIQQLKCHDFANQRQQHLNWATWNTNDWKVDPQQLDSHYNSLTRNRRGRRTRMVIDEQWRVKFLRNWRLNLVRCFVDRICCWNCISVIHRAGNPNFCLGGTQAGGCEHATIVRIHCLDFASSHNQSKTSLSVSANFNPNPYSTQCIQGNIRNRDWLELQDRQGSLRKLSAQPSRRKSQVDDHPLAPEILHWYDNWYIWSLLTLWVKPLEHQPLGCSSTYLEWLRSIETF